MATHDKKKESEVYISSLKTKLTGTQQRKLKVLFDKLSLSINNHSGEGQHYPDTTAYL